MNKKRLVSICTLMVLAVFCLSLLAACDFSGDDGKDATPKEYTIQYTDDTGLHTLTVIENMLYSLETIPERKGYKFLGLFNAQEGGKQYVLANGTAVSTFTDGKNIVLYPQFKADEYTVILDYQDAQVTGERQLTIEYATSLPELPKDLTLAHKKFVGWFTAPNCQGVKVADQYGLIPVVSVFNENNFDLSQDIIYLYAGFEVEKFSVTCYFGGNIASEELQVEYDTPISQVVPETRVDGKAPIAWSKTQGGEVFNGKIVDNTTLYALEYAPVIELNVNGGDKIIPIVAREGANITLPTPTKSLAKFLYWEDSQGIEYQATVMPAQSISLKAVWQGKLVFDENGGSDVVDISEKAGETIELPTPEKEGYLFAGWYTIDKEVYSSTKMPVNGVALKAGWYKEKTANKVLISANKSAGGKTPTRAPSVSYLCYTFNIK
ncbi:MAG: InlB B-repeat-containing protein, partial [Lactobacillus sp.]|nr:InlB B-repeat-containing protein [Lactobacillus sp.]